MYEFYGVRFDHTILGMFAERYETFIWHNLGEKLYLETRRRLLLVQNFEKIMFGKIWMWKKKRMRNRVNVVIENM